MQTHRLRVIDLTIFRYFEFAARADFKTGLPLMWLAFCLQPSRSLAMRIDGVHSGRRFKTPLEHEREVQNTCRHFAHSNRNSNGPTVHA